MEKLTSLRRPLHPTVFRTDLFELTLSCHEFVTAELRIWLIGKRRDRMLQRVPELKHSFGQGETIGLLDMGGEKDDADKNAAKQWDEALSEYFGLLHTHKVFRENAELPNAGMKILKQRRLELVFQALQCYRKMHALFVAAQEKRNDLN